MKARKTLALFALLALGATAAEARPSKRTGLDLGLGGLDFQGIVGGTDVQAGDPVAASTVLVVGREFNVDAGGQAQVSTFICTGTVLDKDIILTAAHCLGTDGLAKTVVAFRTNIENEGPVVAVKDRRRMSDFLERVGEPTDWHDLAVIRLEKPIPDNYKPAKFLPDASALRTGSTVTLAGYGMNVPLTPEDSSKANGSGVLRKVEQSVLEDKFGNTEFLVSLANNKGSCHGDSGGPAYLRQGNELFLVGVASRMTEKDRVANNGDVRDFSCSVEMVYTNALKQMNWIKTAIQQLRTL